MFQVYIYNIRRTIKSQMQTLTACMVESACHYNSLHVHVVATFEP